LLVQKYVKSLDKTQKIVQNNVKSEQPAQEGELREEVFEQDSGWAFAPLLHERKLQIAHHSQQHKLDLQIKFVFATVQHLQQLQSPLLMVQQALLLVRAFQQQVRQY
jgi:hypothetical protein